MILDAFLGQLPNCVNREMIDSAAAEFCMNHNTKASYLSLSCPIDIFYCKCLTEQSEAACEDLVHGAQDQDRPAALLQPPGRHTQPLYAGGEQLG